MALNSSFIMKYMARVDVFVQFPISYISVIKGLSKSNIFLGN